MCVSTNKDLFADGNRNKSPNLNDSSHFQFFILIYFVLFFPIVFPLTSILVPQIMKKNQRNLVSLEIQLGNRL